MALHTTQDQFQINYDVFNGLLPQTTLFLHGNLASNRWWMPMVEKLQSKGKNNAGAVICAEFRGCGQSQAPKNESDVTLLKFATDFIDLIKSNPTWGKINIVGHSTGGLVAAYMLALAPELFNKAYLLDPVGAEGITFDTAMISAFEAMKQDKALTATVIGSTIYQNNAESSYFKNIIVEDAFAAVKTVGHLVLKALDGLNLTNELCNVQHSVKVVHGEFDKLLPQADSEKLAALFKNGQFAILKNCGHCGNIENTELFIEDMNLFFGA